MQIGICIRGVHYVRRTGTPIRSFLSVKKDMSFQFLWGNYTAFHITLPREWSWPFKQQKTWANAQVKHVNFPCLCLMVSNTQIYETETTSWKKLCKKCDSIVIDLYVATYIWLYTKKSSYCLILLESRRAKPDLGQKNEFFSDWGIIKYQLEDNLGNPIVFKLCTNLYSCGL